MKEKKYILKLVGMLIVELILLALLITSVNINLSNEWKICINSTITILGGFIAIIFFKNKYILTGISYALIALIGVIHLIK